MQKNLVKTISIAFVLTSSNPALASGYKDTIEQCLAAHQAGDKGKVKLIASEIASIKMYGDQTRIDTAKCMTMGSLRSTSFRVTHVMNRGWVKYLGFN